jgi:hypothetical protein
VQVPELRVIPLRGGAGRETSATGRPKVPNSTPKVSPKAREVYPPNRNGYPESMNLFTWLDLLGSGVLLATFAVSVVLIRCVRAL